MKKMSDNYGKLLLMYKSIGSTLENENIMDKCHSTLQFRTKIILNQKLDSQFYELLIKLYSESLKLAFILPWERDRIKEEIARLFRSNCFNSTRREHEIEQKQEKFPILTQNLV